MRDLAMIVTSRRCAAAAVAVIAVALSPAGPGRAQAAHQGPTPRPPAVVWPGYPLVSLRTARTSGDVGTDITTDGSLNWSGYAVSRARTSFRSISATFFVPYLACAESPGKALSSHWVGLDGFVGHPVSVEQVGIAADCSRAGKSTYYGWYEMYPHPETKATIALHAGNSVTAQVAYNPADRDFRLTLTDNTTGGRFSTVKPCPDTTVGGRRVTCPRSSAELVSEAPTVGAGKHYTIAHLADYGAVSFAAITIVDSAGAVGAIVSPHWGATKIVQYTSNTGPVVARPTPTQANTFSNYWARPA
jgi:hypothetical protein